MLELGELLVLLSVVRFVVWIFLVTRATLAADIGDEVSMGETSSGIPLTDVLLTVLMMSGPLYRARTLVGPSAI